MPTEVLGQVLGEMRPVLLEEYIVVDELPFARFVGGSGIAFQKLCELLTPVVRFIDRSGLMNFEGYVPFRTLRTKENAHPAKG